MTEFSEVFLSEQRMCKKFLELLLNILNIYYERPVVNLIHETEFWEGNCCWPNLSLIPWKDIDPVMF